MYVCIKKACTAVGILMKVMMIQLLAKNDSSIVGPSCRCEIGLILYQ
jgi:hypothetical protein